MVADLMPPRFSILAADEAMIRFVPDARCRVFDGAELFCVASSPERARQIVEAMTGQQTLAAEIDPQRMNAAGQAFNAAPKKKLRAAILAYLAPPAPQKNNFMADDIAF